MGAFETLAQIGDPRRAGFTTQTRPELTDASGQTYSLQRLAQLTFGDLGRFKAAGRFPDPYPQDTLSFYAPRDPGGHAVLAWALMQASHTLAVNCYGFDDDLLAAVIAYKAADPSVTCVVNLDKSQAGGVHERTLLAALSSDMPGNLIAIGQSEQHAISHLKLAVCDGLRVSGSMNWSQSGEQKQDNELTVTRLAPLAVEAIAVILRDHDVMRAQMPKAA